MQKKSLTKTKMGGTRALSVEKTVTPTVQSVNVNPSREEIAQRAYDIYVARGQTAGRELEDWAQAERELMSRVHSNN